jgi:ABC-type Zn uptake system ZnuABC Zn-binding protein ZnuA
MKARRLRWLMAAAGAAAMAAGAADAPVRVVCTLFPVYQLAATVTEGRDAIRLSLLLPEGLGCPHHYAVTPQDMRGLADADMVISHGLGLDGFLDAAIAAANPAARRLAAAADLDGLIADGACAHSHASDEPHACGAINDHVMGSPRMAAAMARAIADGLAGVDPPGAGLYRRNAAAFADRMESLARDLGALGRTVRNRRLVAVEGLFDYLARDAGLEIVGHFGGHDRTEPSAADLLALLRDARGAGVGAVVSDADTESYGKAIARELGVPLIVLDGLNAGPPEAPAGYLESRMRENLLALGALPAGGASAEP